MDQNTCQCAEDMRVDRVVVHLQYCPEGYSVKNYDKLPWWKKLFTSDPRNMRGGFLPVIVDYNLRKAISHHKELTKQYD